MLQNLANVPGFADASDIATGLQVGFADFLKGAGLRRNAEGMPNVALLLEEEDGVYLFCLIRRGEGNAYHDGISSLTRWHLPETKLDDFLDMVWQAKDSDPAAQL
jgi:hypothetical protein